MLLPHLAFWGKASKPDGSSMPEWHPLLCHSIDVACVGGALLARLPAATLRILEHPFPTKEAARAWLLFLLALHDVGKATAGFQSKWEGFENLLGLAGIGTPSKVDRNHHGDAGAVILRMVLTDPHWVGLDLPDGPESFAALAANAVASHHGNFISADSQCRCEDESSRWWPNVEWKEAFRAFLKELANLTGILSYPAPEELTTSSRDGFTMVLAGLASVADWIGSDADHYFPYCEPPSSAVGYWETSIRKSEDALSRLEWHKPIPTRVRPFRDVFPFEPSPLQQKIEELTSDLLGPSLIIIEAPMGDGKTEAAFYAADVLTAQAGNHGLYAALPTKATANQAHQRLRDYLDTLPGSSPLKLTHGDSHFVRVTGDVADPWFNQSKRALLSNYGVGTVDQALAGVLKSPHHFVRQFGLSGKVVILDEVHAYDTYTSELLDRLVEWLGAVGSSVVVLSATLPKHRREKLILAFGAPLPTEEVSYPRVTVANHEGSQSHATRHLMPEKSVCVSPGDRGSVLGSVLSPALENGGCVAWVCNTVTDAQQAYLDATRARSEGKIHKNTQILLLHARLLRGQRAKVEGKLSKLFGPRAKRRPKRALLIGTQIIEQSLDLDFDFMVTDLCPIDILLQRLGRLHRHVRQRPLDHTIPRVTVLLPKGEPSTFSSYVYDSEVLARSWGSIQGMASISLPSDIERLVESVYGDGWVGRDNEEKWRKAHENMLFPPGLEESQFDRCFVELEDSPDSALTRWAPPSFDVICLWFDGVRYSLDKAQRHIIDIAQPPTRKTLRDLLLNGVSLECRRIKKMRLPVEDPWKKVPSLRHRRLLAVPVQGGSDFQLDPDLGLVLPPLTKELP